MSNNAGNKLNGEVIVLRSPAFPYSHKGANPEHSIRRAKVLNESLLLGSPSLFSELAKPAAQMDGRLSLSLQKYLLRMSYRCTPFGLFSGVSSGSVSDRVECRLGGLFDYQKHTRLDNHFLNTFIEKLYSDSELKKNLRWFSNSSRYDNEFGLRYVEYRLTNAQREHHLSRVQRSDYLMTVLDRAKAGATLPELADTLVSDEISEEEAADFIHQLIEGKLLLSELEPVVTGREPHARLIELLAKYEAGRKYADELALLVTLADDIDKAGPGASEELYQKIFAWIRDWDSDYDTKLVLQSDFSKPVKALTLSKEILSELQTAISFLARINVRPENFQLKTFKEEFIKRYEDAEVPLLEALDAESGIGYAASAVMSGDPSPLLNGLAFSNGSTEAASVQYPVNRWTQHLMRLYQQSLRAGGAEIKLTDNDLGFGVRTQQSINLPDSFHTMCSILGDEEEVNKGNFVIDYKGSGGPSSANLLGRFCHVDPAIHQMVSRLITAEEALQPDVVFAEIVHLAQARIGNVLIRPSLRRYEIPILTFPSVNEDHVIPLQDIMVSVRNGNVVLRSKRLNRLIKPRNTNAHNHSNNTIPYYHFLCDLQFQDMEVGLGWNWGVLGEFKFLPRVSYGKVIFSRAKWVVVDNDIALDEKASDKTLFEKVLAYRQRENLPRQVVLTQSDNQLPLDLEDEMCVKILAQELKRNKRVVLEENLFNEENLLVEGPEGKFTNEFIIPWTKVAHVNTLSVETPKLAGTKRSFVPGSEWHYIKIYCGLKTSDSIMSEVIKPLTEKLINKQIISEWFFIRYQDTDYHLRVRFKGDGAHAEEVTKGLNQMLEPYIASGLVWKVQTDTYNRELERYGGKNVMSSEKLFFYDSVASVEVLALLDGDEGDEVRWLFCIKGINDLLGDFGYTMEEKEKLMQSIRDGFAREFNATDRDSQKGLSEHYRKYRKEVDLILEESIGAEHDYAPVWDIFSARSKNATACIAAIRQYSSQPGALPLNNLMSSYIHMFVNRFMRSKQRLHELVMYDFLCQNYRSTLARERKNKLVVDQPPQLIKEPLQKAQIFRDDLGGSG